MPPGTRGHNNPLAAIHYDRETATRIATELTTLYSPSGGRAKIMTAPKVPAHMLARTRENPMPPRKSLATQKTYIVRWEDWHTGSIVTSRVKAGSAKAAAHKIEFFDPQTQQRVLSVRLVKPRAPRPNPKGNTMATRKPRRRLPRASPMASSAPRRPQSGGPASASA